MTNEETPPVIDTRLRTLDEIMVRLINPIPSRLIVQKDQGRNAGGKIDYVNVTTRKDLLDWACGFGRWRATIEGVHIAGSFLGMIVRLHVQTLDEGWLSNDGTGSEDLKPHVGDPFSNAYAQGLQRAAESFGLARELWRRDKQTRQPQITPAQEAAHRWIKGQSTARAEEIPAAADDDENGGEHDQRPAQPAASSGTSGSRGTARAASSTAASASQPGAPTTIANKKPEELTAADLRAMQAEGGPVVDEATLKQLRAITKGLPKFNLDDYCENTIKVEVGNLKLSVAVALIARAKAAKAKTK